MRIKRGNKRREVARIVPLTLEKRLSSWSVCFVFQIKVLLIGILLLFSISTSAIFCQTTHPQALNQARNYLETAQYDKALRAAELFLRQAKNAREAVEGLILMGNVFLETSDPEAARQQWVAAQQALNFLPHSDSLKAQVYTGLGACYLKTGKTQRALIEYKRALDLRLKIYGPIHEKTADAYNNLGNCQLALGDYERAEQYHLKALDIRQKTLPDNHPDLAASYTNLGNCAFYLGRYEQAIAYSQKALELRRKIYGAAHPKIAQSLNNLGRAYFEMGQYAGALRCYQNALDIRKKLSGSSDPSLAPLYENLGDLWLEKNEAANAETHFRQAYALIGNDNPAAAAALWHKIGLCRQENGDYDQALQYHREALAVIEKQYGAGHPFTAAVNSNLGNCLLQKRDYPAAMAYLQRAAKALAATYPEGHPDLVMLYNNLAVSLLRQGRVLEALAALEHIQSWLSNPAVTTPILAAMTLKNTALALAANQQFQLALTKMDQAIAQLAAKKTRNPSAADQAIELLSVYTAKGRVLLDADAKNAPAATRIFEQALSIAQNLRNQLSAAARRQWNEQQYALYAGALEANFIAWQEKKLPQYLERAFLLSEQYKSLTLLEAVQLTNAEHFAGVPDQLLQQESNLKNQLAELEKLRMTAAAKGLEKETATLDQRYFLTQQALTNLQKKLRKNYPNYQQLAAETEMPSVATIQKDLAKDQALIEFFTGDKELYVFVLTPNQLKAQRIAKDFPLETWVADFRAILKAYPRVNGAQLEQNIQDWVTVSRKLCQRLFEPIVAQNTLPARLIIAPDGILHYLPFEALLSSTPADVHQFKRHAYLIKQYAFSYAFSGSFLHAILSNRQSGHAQRGLLSVAPSFVNNDFGLMPLQYNESEATAVSRQFSGKALLGNQATLAHFLELAPKYRILHLATHGKAAPTQSDYSFLAFAEQRDSLDNEFLYARDLYNLKLPCELVVLSACETGVGAFQHGEGIIGLSRGFFYAGARSLTTTLWSVDDSRTSALVEQFFAFLKKRLPKDEALQAAKLDFLSRHPNDEAHPFYWAGVAVYGSVEPLRQSNWLLVFIVITALAAGISCFWYWRRKKQQKG